MKVDFNGINRAVLAQAPGILNDWLPGGQVRGREFVCGNLSGDPGESLSVNMDSGMWKDFSTDEGGKDPVSLFAAIHGLKQGEAARRLSEQLRLDQGNASLPAGRKAQDKTTWTSIIPVPPDAPAPMQQHFKLGELSAIWRYHTQNGRLIGCVGRFDKADGGKEVLPQMFAQGPSGRRAWRWMSFPKPRPLYRLDALAQAPEKSVVITEGEKAADAAQRLLPDYVAVTWPGGCKAVQHADFAPMRGRNVVIWPDADTPGLSAAQEIAKQCMDAHAAQVRVIEPPADVKAGWDAADAEAEGWTREQALALVKQAQLYDHGGHNAEQQEAPRPLRRPMPQSADFPMDALGDVLASAAQIIHDVVKAPAAICGQSILAAAALAVQGHGDISIDGRVRPVSLFALTWGETGERKSSVDEQALWPHKEHERRLNEAHNQDLPEYEAASAAWKKSREQALNKAKDYATRKQALKDLGPAPDPPLLPMLCVSEPSYPGLVKLMAAGQPSMGLFSDEGGKMFGGYAMSEDNIVQTAAGLSGIWDGKPIDRVRAGDGASKLYGRRLSLHLMAQPVLAGKIMSSHILSGQGFLSRCLPCWPESTAGSRTYEEVDLSKHPVMQRYCARILSIFGTPLPLAPDTHNELAPRQLLLDRDAKALWIRFHDHIERQLADGKALAPVRGFANKSAEHAARIAGVLALADDIHCRQIHKRFIEAGIELCQYYLSEALRLFDAGACDPDLSLAEKLLLWACRQGRYVHLAQIYQTGPNALRDAKTARRIARILEEHGWLLRVTNQEVDGAKRREAWQVITNGTSGNLAEADTQFSKISNFSRPPTPKQTTEADTEFSKISNFSRGQGGNPATWVEGLI